MNTEVTEKLKQLAAKYTQGVDNIIKKVESTTLKDIAGTIAESENLGKLTQTTLDVINKIEQAIEAYEKVMSSQDFFIRQEYNIARYKLDTAVSAHHWDYYGRANYVWAG